MACDLDVSKTVPCQAAFPRHATDLATIKNAPFLEVPGKTTEASVRGKPMTARTATKATAVDVQEVCIDLPGEVVQCWRSSDHIRVRLRKHRDVFFDLNLNTGSTYTVESRSDFYCPRDKKLLKKSSFMMASGLTFGLDANLKAVLW